MTKVGKQITFANARSIESGGWGSSEGDEAQRVTSIA